MIVWLIHFPNLLCIKMTSHFHLSYCNEVVEGGESEFTDVTSSTVSSLFSEHVSRPELKISISVLKKLECENAFSLWDGGNVSPFERDLLFFRRCGHFSRIAFSSWKSYLHPELYNFLLEMSFCRKYYKCSSVLVLPGASIYAGSPDIQGNTAQNVRYTKWF